MTARSGVPDADLLHDADALTRFDTLALLRSAAGAGAQWRAAVGQVRDLVADQRSTPPERPRSVVVIGPHAVVDTALLVSLLPEPLAVPVLAAGSTPGWIGPLDVVVVLAGSDLDEESAVAVTTARRRGAWTIARGSQSGPVAQAAGPVLLVPALPTPEALAVTARLGVLLTVAAELGLLPRVELAELAEEADAAALTCHPRTDAFLNPAVRLADHLLGCTPLLLGTDRVGDAVAAHGVRSLGELAGVAATSLTSTQARTNPALLAAAGQPVAAADLFADPDDDGGAVAQRVAGVLVTGWIPPSGPDPRALALSRAVPRAVPLEPALPELAGPGGPGQLGERVSAALSLLVRLDFAAVYLGLAAAVAPPFDAPDGLARRELWTAALGTEPAR
ncbi:hypothetical protein J2S58_001263 [Nakamurella flavida]|uniref:hypothetical protein n=1 Tax=Nakamurella flavida TaxID=363630 RepID=UPI002788AD88|nr:hypothetical protein [Nakamurella flavida]MDP9777640.1 hypothetical protein [Nakamurella flavida]